MVRKKSYLLKRSYLNERSDLEKANIKVMKDFFMTLKSLRKYL